MLLLFIFTIALNALLRVSFPLLGKSNCQLCITLIFPRFDTSFSKCKDNICVKSTAQVWTGSTAYSEIVKTRMNEESDKTDVCTQLACAQFDYTFKMWFIQGQGPSETSCSLSHITSHFSGIIVNVQRRLSLLSFGYSKWLAIRKYDQ